MSGKTVITQARPKTLRLVLQNSSSSSLCSSPSTTVLRWKSRLRTNGHGNQPIAYRSNRFCIRNKNTVSISSIDQYIGRIEGKEEKLRNFKRGLLTQITTKLTSTTCYTIYKHHSTIFLAQLKQLQISIPNLFLMTAMDSRGWASMIWNRCSKSLQEVRGVVLEARMCLDCQEFVTVMVEAGFCHSSIPLPFRSNLDQQRFIITCRFWINRESNTKLIISWWKNPKILWKPWAKNWDERIGFVFLLWWKPL